ncbi:hypothetical protein SETIT_1G034000v2 [Setaria italica]|uniref:Uncharacterized protein n=1 Tax=Setaria italica TaxID=4555 RepID=A0A368PGD9_SETIT|nr:hypothetical protein SETIT_1G034000v2 [Setaria italica]
MTERIHLRAEYTGVSQWTPATDICPCTQVDHIFFYLFAVKIVRRIMRRSRSDIARDDMVPLAGVGVPAGDVGLGGGGGTAAGTPRRPGRVVGRGLLLLQPVLRQGHRVRGAARRRARLLRRALPSVRLQSVQQVPSPRRRLLSRQLL